MHSSSGPLVSAATMLHVRTPLVQHAASVLPKRKN